ncbi:MAG: hypothetical protein LBS23_01865, partial [Holosporaceae bacterium]|nr:hypothetical protein [Holosporaceae bacterium]
MEIKDNIFSIADAYDIIFVDMYGVLFDGAELYENALSALKKLRDIGKKIVILSNSTQVSEDALAVYEKRGLFASVHYDISVTSGEFFHTIVTDKKKFSEIVGGNAETVKCVFKENNNVFKGSHLQKIDNYKEADLLYIGAPRVSYGAVRLDDVLENDFTHLGIENIIRADWNNLSDHHGRSGFQELLEQMKN